nr:MAG TPA: hypothetical protein [Caudoviricetes sp.]
MGLRALPKPLSFSTLTRQGVNVKEKNYVRKRVHQFDRSG